ncbi:MAG: DUF5686 family protein, partial [Leadbetterella sp.]
RVTYLGYETKEIPIKPGSTKGLIIKLKNNNFELSAVIIKPKSGKDKKAYDLIAEVFKNKNANRKEGLDFYSFEAYEKLQIDINNITDKFRNKKSLQKFQFIFDNVDTNKVNQKISLPVYLRERVQKVYYRKDPKSEKEYILGEKQVGLKGYTDGNGISTYLNSMYQPVDIYDGAIGLLNSRFVGPLSNLGPSVYRYYIMDTVTFMGNKCIDVFFRPRSTADQAFMGNMLVALDSTFAVRRVQMGVSKNINLNWVDDIYIDQEFDFIGQGTSRRLMLTKDEISMEFELLKGEKGRNLIGKKVVSYKDHRINEPIAEDLFSASRASTLVDSAQTRTDNFWLRKRHSDLTKTEAGIYKMADSVQNIPAFKRTAEILNLFLSGYKTLGWFNLGPVNTFYNYNPVEGFRMRLGGRTNPAFSNRLLLEGYGAYGFKDKVWKYFGGATYAFAGKRPLQWPMNQITATYQYETVFPGDELQFIQEDNALLAIRRGNNNYMFYNRTLKLDYTKEFANGIRIDLGFQELIQSPGGDILFDYQSTNDGGLRRKNITSVTPGISIRYAPNEKFYQGKTYRIAIPSKYPIFQLDYRKGVKGFLGGDYSFHDLNFSAYKVFYIAPFGYSEVTFEAGGVFGTLPYTLLRIHRANQSYAYQLTSYNLMNFLEFVSDRYASINVQQHFNGVFFNKIPLMKKLKWREVISFKGLYGSLTDQNKPTVQNGLLNFPVDSNGLTIMNTLGNEPYMEASVGIENIFRLFRVDYVWRLTYNNLPNASSRGIRARFKIDF